jgi:hypothetical protein
LSGKDIALDAKFNWLALKLAISISIIFLLQLIFPQPFEIFVLNSPEVLSRPWSLITYIFLHGSFTHLFSNMFSLVLFGSIFERVVGYKNFLKVFFLAGIFSGIISIFFYNSVIGASGAVFGIMGVLALLRPKMVVWAFSVPMYMIVVIIFYATLDFLGIFYPSDIAHMGHLSALILGILIGLFWRKKYKITDKKEERVVLDDKEFKKWEEKYMKKLV